MNTTIRALPQNDRPRERLLKQGAKELSSAELLAVLIGSGIQGASAVAVASNLLASFEGLSGLMDASVQEMSRVRGVGKVKDFAAHSCF